MALSLPYLHTLEQMHSQSPNWGSTGVRYLPEIHSYIKEWNFKTLLDYGCGKGSLVTHIGLDVLGVENVVGYDPAVPEFRAKPKGQYDFVTCTDVMEHVEREHIAATIEEIKNYAVEAAWFLIACYPAKAVLPDGRNAHLTVEEPEFWCKQIQNHFKIIAPTLDNRNQLRIFAQV